jgi:hypothetical protein
LHATFTTNTSTIVKIYDTIFSDKKSLGWTYVYAGSIGAMITPHYREYSSRVWVFAFLHLLDPRAVNANGNIVFRLTSDGACMAANTLSVVDYEAVFHKSLLKGQWHVESYDRIVMQRTIEICGKLVYHWVRGNGGG